VSFIGTRINFCTLKQTVFGTLTGRNPLLHGQAMGFVTLSGTKIGCFRLIRRFLRVSGTRIHFCTLKQTDFVTLSLWHCFVSLSGTKIHCFAQIDGFYDSLWNQNRLLYAQTDSFCDSFRHQNPLLNFQQTVFVTPSGRKINFCTLKETVFVTLSDTRIHFCTLK
jgi:hypothetical protein